MWAEPLFVCRPSPRFPYPDGWRHGGRPCRPGAPEAVPAGPASRGSADASRARAAGRIVPGPVHRKCALVTLTNSSSGHASVHWSHFRASTSEGCRLGGSRELGPVSRARHVTAYGCPPVDRAREVPKGGRMRGPATTRRPVAVEGDEITRSVGSRATRSRARWGWLATGPRARWGWETSRRDVRSREGEGAGLRSGRPTPLRRPPRPHCAPRRSPPSGPLGAVGSVARKDPTPV